MLLVVLVPLEVGAAVLAYETLGWTGSFSCFLAILLNVPVLVLVLWRPLLGAVGALALFLALVPYQAVLGARLLRLQEEAGGIIAYTYEHRLRAGEFAADLEAYDPSRPELMRFLHYRLEPRRGGFQLSYWVGSRSTATSTRRTTGGGTWTTDRGSARRSPTAACRQSPWSRRSPTRQSTRASS